MLWGSGLCTRRHMERKLCNGDSHMLIWLSAPTEGYIPGCSRILDDNFINSAYINTLLLCEAISGRKTKSEMAEEFRVVIDVGMEGHVSTCEHIIRVYGRHHLLNGGGGS